MLSIIRIRILMALAVVLLVPTDSVHTAEAAVQGTGTAVIHDDGALSDAITYSMAGVIPPASGKEYVGWLVSDDGSVKLSTGPMVVQGDGSLSHTFDSTSNRYTGENLVHNYSKAMITEELAGSDPNAPAGLVVFSHEVPSSAMAHIRHLLSDWPPGTLVGILTNLKQQLDVAITHANLALNSTTLNDVFLHTHHAINIIEGPSGANYDASFGDPGDGQGVFLHAMDRKHSGFAASAAPGDTVINTRANLVEVSGQHTAGQSTVARDVAVNDVLTQTDISLAKSFVGPGANTVLGYLDSARIGGDADGDGAINLIAGEGGAQQAYIEAQLMATYTLEFDPSYYVAVPGVTTWSVLILALLLGLAAMWRGRSVSGVGQVNSG